MFCECFREAYVFKKENWIGLNIEKKTCTHCIVKLNFKV